MERFWRPLARDETLDPLTELVRCALVLPESPYGGSRYGPTSSTIPEEVEMAYSGMTLLDTGPMQPPLLGAADQVSGTVPNPGTVLRDVGHVLGFVAAGRCEWRQDGEPYKRSLTALGKTLRSADPEYPEALWGMAASAQLLRPVRRGGGGYVPAIGVDASPRELFEGLSLGWVQTGGRELQTGLLPGLAQDARFHLLQLLRIMPADTWVLKASVEEWLRFHWPVRSRTSSRHPHLVG